MTTRAYEGDRNDLFDFPEVEGLEEWGLVPPLPADVQAEVEAEIEAGAGAPEATAPPEVDAPAAATTEAVPATEVPEPAATSAPAAGSAQPAVAAASDDVAVGDARPNPPVPAGVTDLDEDLFHFDEIFSLEEDPYFNGTLSMDGTPTNPLFLDDDAPTTTPFDGVDDPILDEELDAPFQPAPRPVPPPQEPAVDLQQPIHPDELEPRPAAPVTTDEPANAPAPSAPVAAETAAPASDAELPETITPAARPEPISAADRIAAPADAGPAPSIMSGAQATTAALPAGAGATLDRGPRILLPEDVPYSATGDRQRYIWALIGCFLLINTGIFFLAFQASSSVHSTMAEATGLLAEAIASGKDGGAQAAAPVVVSPMIEHTIEEPEEEDEFRPEAWVDPTNYANTHEFAVGNAKALLTEGRFEDARRLLNHVLANQARVPLAPSLREEIDYLIPLTYYEQGNATAPEDRR